MDKRQQSLFIKFNQSWAVLWYLIILHLALSFFVLDFSEQILLKFCLLSVLWGHFAYVFNRYFWRYRTQTLEITSQGEVLITIQAQRSRYSLASSYRCRWFVILYLKPTDARWGKKAVFITFDAIEKTAFHQLMLWLSDTKLYQ